MIRPPIILKYSDMLWPGPVDFKDFWSFQNMLKTVRVWEEKVTKQRAQGGIR